MYKMYKKDRGQWVEVASFNSYSKARYYARRLGFTDVDNPEDADNYYYEKDCWIKDNAILKEPLTDEQLEELETDPSGMVRNYGVSLCRRCGSLFGLTTNSDYVEIDGNYWCDSDCATRDGCFYCEHCDTWYDDSVAWYRTHDGNTICQYCCEDHYCYCDDCGDLFHEYEVYYNDDDGCYYCEDCRDSHEDNDIIKGYHSSRRPDLEVQRTDGDTIQDATFGTETETECKGCYSREEVAQEIDKIVNHDKDLFVFEEDGSLSSQGYETISQPFTMRWFAKNKDLFEKMFAKMIDMGCRSHDTTTCGFHVHFGRHFFGNRQTECIDRLIYLFEKYRPQLQVFSRRRDFEWCNFPKNRDASPIDWSKLDEVKGLNKCNFEGHHSAINLENYETIEIRIFKGTLNFKTYCATLEFVNNIMHYVRDKSDEQVEKGKFEDILNYLPTDYLKQYCLDRNII